MLILGLDPGSRHTGFGLVKADGSDLCAVAHGRISVPVSKPLAQRLAELARQLEALVDRWHPDVAVLETPFHGLNSRSLVVLAQARGVLLAVLATRGVETAEYSPAEVKSAVSGDGRADKAQVGRMVRLQLSLTSAKISTDAADALAVALCYAHRCRWDRLLADRH